MKKFTAKVVQTICNDPAKRRASWRRNRTTRLLVHIAELRIVNKSTTSQVSIPMRRCPSCGNLTTSHSCSRCTGMPMTREVKTGPPEQVISILEEAVDSHNNNLYDGAVAMPVPAPSVQPRNPNERPNCGKACRVAELATSHGTLQDPCRYTKAPHINSLYGRRDHLFRGWLRGFVCWWRAGGFTRMSYVGHAFNWSAGHEWVETGRENHYDSSVTVEFTCQYCGRVGHGQGR